MTEVLTYTVDDSGVARIHLNRPDASNALNPELAAALADAVDRVAGDSNVRVVLLTGSGKNFCAGGDVKGMKSATDLPAFLTDLAGTVHGALVVLDALPVTVVAAVQGAAAGAGLGLALAADFVVAGPASTFVAAYSGVGLSPDCGVSVLLPRAVGLRRATRMLLTPTAVRGVEALEWGLVTDIVDDADITTRAEEIAADIAGAPHPATGETRRLVRASYARSHREHLDDEARTIARTAARRTSR